MELQHAILFFRLVVYILLAINEAYVVVLRVGNKLAMVRAKDEIITLLVAVGKHVTQSVSAVVVLDIPNNLFYE